MNKNKDVIDGVRKILITGSRSCTDDVVIREFLSQLIPSKILVFHGGASGVDSLTESVCHSLGIETVVVRPVDSSVKSHYLYRNVEMIVLCDEVVAFWDGVSRGTKFTIDYACARNKPTRVINCFDGSRIGGF